MLLNHSLGAMHEDNSNCVEVVGKHVFLKGSEILRFEKIRVLHRLFLFVCLSGGVEE